METEREKTNHVLLKVRYGTARRGEVLRQVRHSDATDGRIAVDIFEATTSRLWNEEIQKGMRNNG